MALSRALDI